MSTLAKTFLTPEEYLKIERQAEYKSEYFAGEIFAIAGGGRTAQSDLHEYLWPPLPAIAPAALFRPTFTRRSISQRRPAGAT
jgi:hypothetical protein